MHMSVCLPEGQANFVLLRHTEASPWEDIAARSIVARYGSWVPVLRLSHPPVHGTAPGHNMSIELHLGQES